MKEIKKLVESTVSIGEVKNALRDSHTHNNKDVLDGIRGDGQSDKYLGEDGLYHDIPANFDSDAFVSAFDEEGSNIEAVSEDGKLLLNAKNDFADGVGDTVVGDIEIVGATEKRLDVNYSKVNVKTGEVTEGSFNRVVSNDGIKLSVDDKTIKVELDTTKTPFTSKMDKQVGVTLNNLSIFGANGQVVDSGIQISGLVTVPTFNSHTTNTGIHIQPGERVTWNSKQGALSGVQLQAVNSGITQSKVTDFTAYNTTKFNVGGHAVGKNLVTDSEGKVVTEDKPNMSAKVDKVFTAVAERLPVFNGVGGIKDSGIELGGFPANRTLYDSVIFLLSSYLGGSYYQGLFTYFGTKDQIESVIDPVENGAGESTAIAYEGTLNNFLDLYRGDYINGEWEWSYVSPLPASGMWFEVDFNLASQPVNAARILVMIDNYNAPRLDIRPSTAPPLDNFTVTLDDAGYVSLKTVRLESGAEVLNATTAENIAYLFTDDGQVDTSKTVREVLDTKEESFTKNTAFNKDFDATSGGGESTTVVGNLDTRLTDARSASDVYDWAKNPALLESDVPELSATKITSGKLQGDLVEDNYFVKVGDIEDSLTSVATNKALSANQGRVLNEKVENIKLKFIVEEGF